MLFAYFGPETLLPLTSVLAAVAGFVLMFGRQAFRLMAFVGKRVIQVAAPSESRRMVLKDSVNRDLRRDAPAQSRYRRPAPHQNTEVRS